MRKKTPKKKASKDDNEVNSEYIFHLCYSF
jgi:hypothetical protein